MDPRIPPFGFESKPIVWMPGNDKWTRAYLPAQPTPKRRETAVDRIPSEIWDTIFLYAITRRGGKRPVTSYEPTRYRLERYLKPRVGISNNLPKIDEFDCVNDVFLLRSICKVCRLWRATAVNSQQLWSYIRNDIPLHYVLKMFQRSGEQPLYADIEFDLSIHILDAECIQEILGRLSRIKTLKFDAADSELFSRYLHWFEQPAPMLENLALTSRPHVNTFLFPGQLPDVTILPQNIFNLCAPALRTLLLENVFMPLDNQIFRAGNLTNLHLRYIPFHCQMPLTKTLEVLSYMNHLEVLEMISAGPRDAILDARTFAARVTLPNLQSFSLQGMTNAITHTFVAKLRTPSLVFLDIRHEGRGLPGARYIMPSGFASSIAEMSSLELSVAVIPGQMNFGAYFVPDSYPTDTQTDSLSKPKLVCKYTYKHGEATTLEVDVPIFLSALDRVNFLHNVVALHVDVNHANLRAGCQLTPFVMHQLLWRMPRARLLRFVPAALEGMRVPAEHCLVALCALRGYFQVDGDARMAAGTKAHAPTLRTLVFEGMVWEAMSVARLVDWLRLRLAQNAKMQRICFVGKESLVLREVTPLFEGLVDHYDFYV